MPLKRIRAYVDGSCPRNPGPGGWAYAIVLSSGECIEEASGFDPIATNNTMELQAAIECMGRLLELDLAADHQAKIFSDSQYVIRGMENYRHIWADYNFEGIKNPDLWRIAHERAENFPCKHLRFEWLRGHVGHYWNERCDAMAGAAVRAGNRKRRGKSLNRNKETI